MPIRFNQQPLQPEKVICVGRNYLDHISELGNEVPQQMVLFIKPGSAIADSLCSHHQEPLHYEAELSFLIQQGKPVAVAVGLDLTKRGLQQTLKQQQLPWERAKAFPGSALFSEFVTLPTELKQLRFELSIDDHLVQSGNPELMIHSVDNILEEIHWALPLADNDIIMTGTPKGVGVIPANAQFTVKLWQQQQLLTSKTWVAT
ncbi:fumarylacetoacetate hydrolase family protein [Ferrimonas lipolytica]|uniref:FAA hydrolase family protein n=1 Tax=Ferrimonas lipolytica TaxID=2724191 RepID=A0A6H1UG63_9GAMM|nr:fumarylacetoacetate hydrolase family protein [Ferrimonas lipolytica]QIZ77206.1 FAA hydrolase family protein [Ferrimonas lipolytica]